MNKLFTLMSLQLIFVSALMSQSVSATYNAGHIPTSFLNYEPGCNGPNTVLSVALPAGGPWEVTSITVSYTMTAANNGWRREQRSQIYCQNTATLETDVYRSFENFEGVQSYERENVEIANGSYDGGTVLNFEMRAWRTWQGTPGCNTNIQRVDNGSWTITVHYAEAGSCFRPGFIRSSDIESDEATISWNCIGCDGEYAVEYGPAGFTPGTDENAGEGVVIFTTDRSVLLTGLIGCNIYDVYVRHICSEESVSLNSNRHVFTTLYGPEPPTCGYSFYDTGCLAGNYNNNENITTVICPESNNQYVVVTFESFNVENGWDGLRIFNGNNASAPLYTSGSAFNRPSCPNGSWTGNGIFSPRGISFAAQNSTGCLTFVFTSDHNITRAGWEANVRCEEFSAANDAVCNATILADGGANTLFNQTVQGATISGVTNVACSNKTNTFSDVWYKITTDGDGITGEDLIVTVTPNGNEDYAIYLYSGTCNNLTYLTCADDGGAGASETISYTVADDVKGNGSNNRNAVEFWVRVKEWSFAPRGRFSINAMGSALPIEIIEISARKMERANLISWKTASEVNNDLQIVERSNDGKGVWREVGKIKGRNTTEIQSYEVMDYTPSLVSYYRIRSVDYDGKTQVSRIVLVDRSNESENYIKSLYPNPVSQESFTIESYFTEPSDISIQIMDLSGRLLATEKRNALNGNAMIQIPVTNLANGMYYVLITGDNTNFSDKIVIQR